MPNMETTIFSLATKGAEGQASMYLLLLGRWMRVVLYYQYSRKDNYGLGKGREEKIKGWGD